MAQLDGALLALASVAALAAASRLQRTGSAARPPLQVASFAPGTLFHIREGGSGRGAWPHYGGRPTELVLEPRVPRLPASRQDTTTPRVSLAPRLGGAFWGLGFQNIRADAPGGNDWEVYTNAETVSGTLPTPMEVPDVDETGEVWGLDPVPVRWVRTLTPAQIWKGRDAAWARLGWHPQLRRPPTDWTVEMNAPRKYVWAAIEEALGRGSAAQHVVTSQKWEISSGTYTAAQALDELIWNLWDARYLEFYDLDESASQQQVRTPRTCLYRPKLAGRAQVRAQVLGVLHSYGLTSDDQVLVIGIVDIAPQQRGKGVGTKLVRDAEAWARERGLAAIFLQAGSLDFGASHSLGFWEKMGYDRIPGSRYYDDWIMIKVLD